MYNFLKYRSMRKILEVLQGSTGELTFDTDIDVEKDPSAVMDIMSSAMFCMATKLWGGNEHSVIAVIRSLFKGLVQEAAHMGKLFDDMMGAMEKKGKVQSFAPGVPRPGTGRHGGKKMS